MIKSFSTHSILFGLAINFTSCTVLTNKHDDLKVECGLSPQQTQNQTVVKVVKPDDSNLTTREIASLQGRYIDKLGTDQPLTFTESGCTILNKEHNTLQILGKTGNSSLAITRLNSGKMKNFERLQLQVIEIPSISFTCPNEGYFANETIPFPFASSSNEGLDYAEIDLIARNKSTQIENVIYRKKYGNAKWDQKSTLNVLDLAEGEYELLTQAKQTVQTFDDSLLLVDSKISCPLSIDHSSPGISVDEGVRLGQSTVYQVGEPILWSGDSKTSQLSICRETLGVDEDQVEPRECTARANCVDLNNFEQTNGIRASEKGVFQYFFYSKDRAGNISNTHCRQIVVSEKKPEITISWENSEWNRPHASVDKPYRQVKAHIEATHPQLSDNALKEKLECKVDFIMEGASSLPGTDAK